MSLESEAVKESCKGGSKMSLTKATSNRYVKRTRLTWASSVNNHLDCVYLDTI